VRRKTGGAPLGDRIRMNAIRGERIFTRSLATRGSGAAISQAMPDAGVPCRTAGYDQVIHDQWVERCFCCNFNDLRLNLPLQ